MCFVSRFALLASLLATSLPVAALTREAHLLDISVVDRDSGATLATYFDHGKRYVAGTPGHRYSVHLANRSGTRVLAVLSVDGINAISGETAATAQTGYVLDAWQSADIAGWRKNLDEIAQFNFTALPDSYAARTGRPANVGVIGVAVFTERAQPPPEPRIAEQSANGAADRTARAERETAPPAAPSASMRLDEAKPMARMKSAAPLGTGHGAREYAHVDNTMFERATSQPAETIAIWYDSYANLVARGVIARPIVERDAQPFPNHFVADPPRN